MATQNDGQEPVQNDWLDPFPEPHTIPSGWDFGSLFPALQTDTTADADPTDEMEE
jgi:hypothetical protein